MGVNIWRLSVQKIFEIGVIRNTLKKKIYSTLVQENFEK